MDNEWTEAGRDSSLDHVARREWAVGISNISVQLTKTSIFPDQPATCCRIVPVWDPVRYYQNEPYGFVSQLLYFTVYCERSELQIWQVYQFELGRIKNCSRSGQSASSLFEDFSLGTA